MFLGKSRVAVSASSCHGWELNSAPRSAEGVEQCGERGVSGRKLVLARQPDWGWHEPPPPKMDGRDDICSLWGDFSPPSFTLAEKSRNLPEWGNWGGESKNRNLSNWNQTRRRQNQDFDDSIDPNQKKKKYRNLVILKMLSFMSRHY